MKYTPITRRDGATLWTCTEPGPRGGVTRWYAARRPQDTAPTGWETWSRTMREAGGYGAPAGTFGGPMGLGH